jgi:hypothetical protein
MRGNRSVRLPIAVDGANITAICTDQPSTEIIFRSNPGEKRVYFRPAMASIMVQVLALINASVSCIDMLYRRVSYCQK